MRKQELIKSKTNQETYYGNMDRNQLVNHLHGNKLSEQEVSKFTDPEHLGGSQGNFETLDEQEGSSVGLRIHVEEESEADPRVYGSDYIKLIGETSKRP
jgi:hypothetical protein